MVVLYDYALSSVPSRRLRGTISPCLSVSACVWCAKKKLSQGDIEKRTGLLRRLHFPGEHGDITPTIQTLEKLHALLRLNSCVASDTNSRVSGSVSGNTVSLTATYAGVSVSLGGTVSGNTIAGNYTASGACGADSGTWTATKMPQINGNYSGNLFSNSNPSQAIPVTASIAADSKLAITGNASRRWSNCRHRP